MTVSRSIFSSRGFLKSRLFSFVVRMIPVCLIDGTGSRTRCVFHPDASAMGLPTRFGGFFSELMNTARTRRTAVAYGEETPARRVSHAISRQGLRRGQRRTSRRRYSCRLVAISDGTSSEDNATSIKSLAVRKEIQRTEGGHRPICVGTTLPDTAEICFPAATVVVGMDTSTAPTRRCSKYLLC